MAFKAQAAPWKLPLVVGPENTRVSYVVDSTWHTVHGIVKEPHGKIVLRDRRDPLSVQAELYFPVTSFDSDNSSRDRKMLRVMHADKFTEVVFKANSGISRECAPDKIQFDTPCKSVLAGELNISGHARNVEIPILISRKATGYFVRGELPINWAEYGVEDPSILIAKLDPIVTVSFEINLDEEM